jgi:hypothetical protein
MEENMAQTNAEDRFYEGLEKLGEVLSGMADRLYDFADSIGANDEEELAEINAGKTDEEIAQEDAMAAEIAAPIVNAIEGLTDIVNDTTLKVMELITEPSGSDE